MCVCVCVCVQPRNAAVLAQRVLEQNEQIAKLQAALAAKEAQRTQLQRKLSSLEEAVSMVRHVIFTPLACVDSSFHSVVVSF